MSTPAEGKTEALAEKRSGSLARTVQFWGVILFAMAVLCIFLWSVKRATPTPEPPGSRAEAEHVDRTP